MTLKKQPPPSIMDELLTVNEAQEALRCSRRKIYLLAREGRLRLVKFDRHARITASSLQQLIREIASSPAIGKEHP
jgi:excisionase family DNA binding protein